MKLALIELDSPIGAIRGAITDAGLCELDFVERWEIKRERLQRRFGTLELTSAARSHATVRALRRYFRGELDAIDSVAVDTGGTPFQRSVWRALRRIPAGRTTSYAALAGRIERPRAVRAVGAANGRNPVAIVVPCHRVIGADGSLSGYGGGLERKRWLIDHERRATASDR